MSLQALSQYDETIDTLDKYLNTFGKSISQETLDDMLRTRNGIQRDIDEYPQMRGDAREFHEGEIALYDKIISELKKRLSDKARYEADKARYERGLDPDDDPWPEIHDPGFNAFMEKKYGMKGLGSLAKAITQNDLGRSFEVTETKEDTDGDGDVDKVKIEKKE